MEKIIIDRKLLQNIIDWDNITVEGVLNGRKFDLDLDFEEDKFIELLQIIPLLFEFGKAGKGSYGLKHVLEDFLKKSYCSNAMAILAFKYLHFRTSKANSAQAPNLTIYVKPKFKMDNFQPLARYIHFLKNQSVASNS